MLTAPFSCSLVLSPVHAPNIYSNCNCNGAEDGEDDREDNVAEAVVGLIRIVNGTDARKEDV